MTKKHIHYFLFLILILILITLYTITNPNLSSSSIDFTRDYSQPFASFAISAYASAIVIV